MSEKINFEEFSKIGTGWDWKKDISDHRNFSYEFCFGASLDDNYSPIGRLEKILKSPLTRQENLLYQLHFLSCVPLHIAMYNQFNSWLNDNNEVKLSWAITYALINFTPGRGTSVNEALGSVRKIGQCQDKLFSQDTALELGENKIHNPNLITDEMKEDASHWKIAGHSYLTNLSRASIYSALKHTPLLIGVNLNNNWDNDIIYSANPGMNHLSLLVDIDKDGHWKIWEGFRKDKIDIRTLHKNSYIGMAISMRDIPDDKILELKKKNNMRLVMCSTHPDKKETKKVFALDFSNRLHHYANEDTYQELVHAGKDFSFVEDISYKEFQKYTIGISQNMYGMSLINVIKFYIKQNKINIED